MLKMLIETLSTPVKPVDDESGYPFLTCGFLYAAIPWMIFPNDVPHNQRFSCIRVSAKVQFVLNPIIAAYSAKRLYEDF